MHISRVNFPRPSVAAVALLAIAGLVLTGCGGERSVRSDIQKTVVKPLPDVVGTGPVKKSWSRDIGSGFDSRYFQIVPATSASTVFAADTDGQVSALSISSGDSLWKSDVGENISAGVGFGSSIVVVATSEGQVVALDANTGKEIWRTFAGGEVLAQPVVNSDVVMVRTVDGKVIGLRATDGERQWGYQRPVPGLSLRGTGRPIVYEGIAVTGFANGKIVASEVETGRVLWEIGVAQTRGRNEIERLIDIDAQPVLVGSVLYTAAYQGEVTALALGSRRVLWRAKVSSHRDIDADDNNVYVTGEDSVVVAIDRLTGAERWRQDALIGRKATGPAVIDGHLVVGDGDGNLHIIESSTGAVIGRIKTGDTIARRGEPVGNRLVFLSENGELSVFTAGGG